MAEIRMAKLSPTMEMGTVAKWHKKAGDRIEAGDLLLEIATDKATIEYNALDEGFLRKVLVEEGGEAKVGEPIALFTDSLDEPLLDAVTSTAPSPPLSRDLPLKKEEMSKPPSIPSKERLLASPLAKKIARERGIDLHAFSGSGPGGRILRRDLPVIEEAPHFTREERREEPLSQIRKVIAEKLQKAKQEIPHFYLTLDIDAGKLSSLQQELIESGHGVTLNDLIVKAAALALRKHPEVNVGFHEGKKAILHFGSIDLCVAVSTDKGLITPFVKEADQKGLLALSLELKDLIKRARAGKLQLHEFQGGSFTLSNLGMFGISQFQAIINPPQGAILACGALESRPVVHEGQIAIGKMLTVTLSVDHRIIDGAQAAQFLSTFKSICEKPISLIL